MHGIQIRVRLAGCGRYEHASSFELRDQVPHIGDFIEVPLADRMVRAQVVSTSPPICRGEDIVTYLVYAAEFVLAESTTIAPASSTAD